MISPRSLLLSALLLQQTLAAPTLPPRQLFDTITPLDEVILFDSPAFVDPSNPSNQIASFRTFVHLKQIDFGVAAQLLSSFIESLGIDVGESITILEERAKLFAALGLPDKEVTVNVNGCNTVTLEKTESFPDLGMLERNVSLGACANVQSSINAEVDLSFIDSRKLGGVVYPSPPDGFGIISDIDDTIKISNVLDTIATVKSTFLEEPKPVLGMPELFTHLQETLNSPQFIYVSGSPFQLYPMLREFVNANYQPGPILLQNLTFIDIPGVLEFVQGATAEYKSERIDTIHGWYPGKKFVAIGDSTQADPEVYGAAFNRLGGDFIHCIWIREVEGAENGQERFDAAFEGVPADKFRVFKDPSELIGLDVENGEC